MIEVIVKVVMVVEEVKVGLVVAVMVVVVW